MRKIVGFTLKVCLAQLPEWNSIITGIWIKMSYKIRITIWDRNENIIDVTFIGLDYALNWLKRFIKMVEKIRK